MILRGWKDIRKAMGGMSENAVRDLMKNEALPITMITGRPTTTTELLIRWVSDRCERTSYNEEQHEKRNGNDRRFEIQNPRSGEGG